MMKILSVLGFLLLVQCQNSRKIIEPPIPAPPLQHPIPTPLPTPPPQPPTPTSLQPEIFVMTYNICWECMTHSSHHGSAAKLGAQCPLKAPSSTLTICADHMADLIQKIETSYKRSFDFIAFQEASRWQEIQNRVPSLGKMKVESFKRGKDDFTTLYDGTKFTLTDKVEDGFVSKGRPFQILIFKEKLIFINLHNCHGTCVYPKFVETELSRGLGTLHLSSSRLDELKTYRIIAVGDFNDNANRLTQLVPFRDLGIKTKVSIKNPPHTCCSNHVPWAQASAHPGDYILDSEDPIYIDVPEDYDYTQPASDHLPVISRLKGLVP